MRVTARREPSETGLAGVRQGPRGYIIKANGKDMGRVSVLRKGFGEYIGWYWYTCSGEIPHKNTAADSLKYPTKEAARDACIQYIRECLKPLSGKHEQGPR